MTLEQDILAARILIVDDQLPNVQLLQRLLADAGYTNVASTMAPTEVCELYRRDRHDLILLDLKMPTMSGFEVMEGLKVFDESGYVPVIVLTAQPGEKLPALNAGARDFISKPFDLVEVKTRIHHMLEVRLLHRQLAQYNAELERAVQERTAELQASEERYRCLAELASDWYWEQDERGEFTRVSGPVVEMLGIRVGLNDGAALSAADDGWDEADREALQSRIAARQPFLDFGFQRLGADGSRRQFRVSGQPMFDPSCRFLGYRGIGVEVSIAK
ncbi:MAG: response regulator [Burkholderiales bacterium]